MFVLKLESRFFAWVLFLMYNILMPGAGNAWFICDSLLQCRILLAILIEASHLYLCCGRWKSLIPSDSNSTNLQTLLSQEMLLVISMYKLRLKKDIYIKYFGIKMLNKEIIYLLFLFSHTFRTEGSKSMFHYTAFMVLLFYVLPWH